MRLRLLFALIIPIFVCSCIKRPSGFYEPYMGKGDREYEAGGIASWYGSDFHGKTTASGEIYDMDALTCAHRSLPFGALLEVTNLMNNQSVVVKVNDRGPFVDERLIDVSREAAKILGFLDTGTAPVRVVWIDDPPDHPNLAQHSDVPEAEALTVEEISPKSESEAAEIEEELPSDTPEDDLIAETIDALPVEPQPLSDVKETMREVTKDAPRHDDALD